MRQACGVCPQAMPRAREIARRKGPTLQNLNIHTPHVGTLNTRRGGRGGPPRPFFGCERHSD
eukprot:4075550-Lingulodinium_polyedra.AAC.1